MDLQTPENLATLMTVNEKPDFAAAGKFWEEWLEADTEKNGHIPAEKVFELSRA